MNFIHISPFTELSKIVTKKTRKTAPKGRNYFETSNPFEGLKNYGGMPKEKIEELLKEEASNFKHFCILFTLSNSVHFFGEGVYLGKFNLRILL